MAEAYAVAAGGRRVVAVAAPAVRAVRRVRRVGWNGVWIFAGMFAGTFAGIFARPEISFSSV
ncbi:hypothetical protein QA861_38820 [Streptomyces sp. B21-083]